MKEERPKIFDGITIFLILLLVGLILVIGGLLFWKEKNIETEIKFFNQLKSEKKFDEITKGDIILISFSGPVRADSFSDNLSIEPRIKFKTDWKNDHQLYLKIEENLAPDFRYNLFLKNFKSKWGMTNQGKEFVFFTDPLPELFLTKPSDGEESIKTDQEISFEFKEEIPKQYFLKIKTEPEFEFQLTETGQKNVIKIKSLENLKFDTEYKITAEIKSQNYFDFNREIINFSFKTERPPTVVYGWDENGEPTKFDFREELLAPAILVGRYIDIDLTNQNLYIFEDGKERGAFKVSTGLRGMNTPTGEFKVMGKYTRPWSKKYSLFMPWFIQFTNQGHGIHELPEWSGGYKEGANHLGIPVSHGCVRLGVGPAKEVYDFVEKGTAIIIHY
jgi:uncharacterized protein YxeA